MEPSPTCRAAPRGRKSPRASSNPGLMGDRVRRLRPSAVLPARSPSRRMRRVSASARWTISRCASIARRHGRWVSPRAQHPGDRGAARDRPARASITGDHLFGQVPVSPRAQHPGHRPLLGQADPGPPQIGIGRFDIVLAVHRRSRCATGLRGGSERARPSPWLASSQISGASSGLDRPRWRAESHRAAQRPNSPG